MLFIGIGGSKAPVLLGEIIYNMESSATKLMEKIIERPDAFLVARKEENYDLFLDLYQQVGYAPKCEDEIEAWRERSRETWKLQDSILPGNYTGGLSDGRVVSAFGALPMTTNALWGHSGCMIKTLDAAITFFAQALHIVDRVENSPGASCYVGTYAHKSRLTTLFQRPLSGRLTNQLEVEVVGVPYDFGISNETGLELRSEPITQDDFSSIPEKDYDFFTELCSCNPLFGQMYQAAPLALKDASSGVIQCLALVQTAPPEVTAVNLFSRTWIFPAIHVQVTSQFIQSLRSVPELLPSYLQVVLRQRNEFALNDLKMPLLPAFWAVTPKEQFKALRASYRDAFLPVLDSYSSDELREQARRLDK